ncbi:formate dehydrogenase subunit alpha [Mesorhizobium sp.]|uniref:formate dehydrogenase subunit alpha n=2 Tax=unclassified Mesorhizobium TaxID=325217 RepID=UPI000FE78567|nr:formate dehydrogenase subunit alpha [Mesorhizobium sp.]RWG51383.1 MAG: formate dehydrogenase subunit alpha [Mesorhizobium sp.]RWH50674.1 MAG: formate dehydrogenase subunit alpha [Mesorhizobium sp.]RWH60079.1 MAG: formate dehydrogenase subunit alpha [Mesorhizobium sp.]RWI77369.1 MAG: formate dehydrogenase subunit alpha [Mesorhizobium sp.]RWI80582.1 MAG: formate dehydrogenase subunit alpha [Mesorhizobium sp.]
MADGVIFTLDGKTVTAADDETIWDVAKREGTRIPHLCHVDMPGYRPDGNCRACMVDVEGERVLAASCIRKPSAGMVVKTDTERARKSREIVFELLASNMRPAADGPDQQSMFWQWAGSMGISGDRYSSKFASDDVRPEFDITNPAIAVNLDSCITCGACVRACREVQVNDVIGMAERGNHSLPVFDMHDPMGLSTCVTCGECVQACPTGALYEKSLMDKTGKTRVIQEFDKVIDTLCPFCGVGCQTSVAVKDNKIVQVDGRNGYANENRLCVKGRFGFDYAMSPERLTKPLIRRDDAPKSGDLDMRGVDPLTVFREATWEEALARATGGLKRILKDHGGQALAGFGSAKGSNEEAYLFQKLVRQGFGTNNVDHCTRLCHASSVAALMEGVGSGAVSAPFNDALKAECIIVIGARPTTNHPVAATYFKQAAKRGAKLIVMDPRGQDLMRHASHSLRFKAGSDVAMLNALIHVIVEEKLYDEQYIQANASGFEALKAKVKDFSPEAMAEVCGVEASVLRDVARTYATAERSIIFWGMGISQHTHGTDNARCLIALALITGHVGRPGTGLHPLRGQNNVQGASDAGLIPMYFPDYKSVENIDIRGAYENFWGQTLDPKRGLTVVEIIDAIHEGEIKGMYIMGENPAMSDPDQTHARQALAMLDHLVVQDIFLTETAWHADVVLPASAHAEKLGTYTNTNRQVQIGRPALELPGQARQDWELIVELARRVGLDWNYGHVSDVYAEMASVMPSLKHISWDRVEREGSVVYPADGPDKPGNEIIFSSGFPTADGRGRIVPADLLPPDEVPDEEFPLVLTTGRLLEHWHTGAMTRRAGVLDAIEPHGIAAMNPYEIKRHGLRQGEMIAVETRRGTVDAILRADREVADGMVFMPFCFNESPANMLTNPMLDPYGKIPEFKYCAARISSAAKAEAAE